MGFVSRRPDSYTFASLGAPPGWCGQMRWTLSTELSTVDRAFVSSDGPRHLTASHVSRETFGRGSVRCGNHTTGSCILDPLCSGCGCPRSMELHDVVRFWLSFAGRRAPSTTHIRSPGLCLVRLIHALRGSWRDLRHTSVTYHCLSTASPFGRVVVRRSPFQQFHVKHLHRVGPSTGREECGGVAPAPARWSFTFAQTQ